MDDVRSWLLDPADPAVRARALVQLEGKREDDADVQAARRESVVRGSVARVLEGLVVGQTHHEDLYRPKYGAPYHRLVALAEMGAPGDEPRIAAVLDACLDAWYGPLGGPFDPEQEVCLTGNLARSALRLGRGNDPRVARAIEWLVAAQKEDGGWHCFESATGTLDAWEALGAFAALPRAKRPRDAIARGVEFFLKQQLGMDDAYAAWRRIHVPRHYYYDVLVGLDLVTDLGDAHDARLAPALEWLRAKRGADGRWRADAQHPDTPESEEYAWSRSATPLVVEPTGEASKWATLAGLRVLARVDASAREDTAG